VAARAAWAAGFLEAKGAETALAAAIPGARTPALRAALLRALWRFASPVAREAAMAFVADADPGVRTAAIYVLARRPRPDSLPALTAALEDPDPQTAALAARALGILGKSESIAPLAAAVGHVRTPVTISAMLALAAVLEKNPDAAFPADQRGRVVALAGDVNPNLAVPAWRCCGGRWHREAFRRCGLSRRPAGAAAAGRAPGADGGLGAGADRRTRRSLRLTRTCARGGGRGVVLPAPADAAPRRASWRRIEVSSA
jgi:hypothetical protein